MNDRLPRIGNGVHMYVHPAQSGLLASTGLKSTFVSDDASSEVNESVRIEHAGYHWSYRFLLKRDIDRYSKLFVLRTREQRDDWLLICNPLSPDLSMYCREHGIQFIDQAGNCYLRRDGLIVFVCGLKADMQSTTPDKGITPAALKLMLAALSSPAVLNRSYRSIAPAAMISTGAVGAALDSLVSLGLVDEAPGRTRFIGSPEKLLDTWTTGYVGLLRPRLSRQRFSSSLPLEQTIESVMPTMHEVLIGGEAAAAAITRHLKPASLTLYLDLETPQALADVVRQLRLRKDPQGPIEIAPIFWNTTSSFPYVPEALIYADLVASGDSRNLEVARLIAQRIIDHVHNTR